VEKALAVLGSAEPFVPTTARTVAAPGTQQPTAAARRQRLRARHLQQRQMRRQVIAAAAEEKASRGGGGEKNLDARQKMLLRSFRSRIIMGWLACNLLLGQGLARYGDAQLVGMGYTFSALEWYAIIVAGLTAFSLVPRVLGSLLYVLLQASRCCCCCRPRSSNRGAVLSQQQPPRRANSGLATPSSDSAAVVPSVIQVLNPALELQKRAPSVHVSAGAAAPALLLTQRQLHRLVRQSSSSSSSSSVSAASAGAGSRFGSPIPAEAGGHAATGTTQPSAGDRFQPTPVRPR
jgi:hypothetical protein